MDFWDLLSIKNVNSAPGPGRFKFVVVSGDFPKNGVALPFGNYAVRRAALREFYLYKGKTFWSKAKIRLLQVFNFALVWKTAFPKKFFANLDPAGENLSSFLASKIGSAEPIIFSIYVGSRKFIFPIFGKKSGRFLGVAKVYFPGRESADYGENEARILNYLSKVDLPEFSFPRVIAKDYFQQSLVVILSPLLTKHSNILQNVGMFCDARKINSIGKPHIDFLQKMSEKTGKKNLFRESNFHKEFQKEIGFLKSKISEKLELVEYFWDKAAQNLQGKEFIFSLTKREFPFFEALRSNDKLFVIDWETARFDFPPIFDVFSMILSTSPHQKGDYIKIYRKNIQALFFCNNPRVRELLEKMLDFWNMSKEDAYWFFWLFLIDQLYIHLHVDHWPSAKRILSFLQNARNNEIDFSKRWISSRR